MTTASTSHVTPIVVKGIRKAFGAREVLRGVDLEIRASEGVAILGSSGTGKSVLLKIITGLLAPDAGEIELWGTRVLDLREAEWLPFRRRMGLVFQGGALFDSMTVYENVAFPLIESGERDEEKLRARVAELLSWVELPGTESRLPSELSGGMRKRVALARTLAIEPDLILYDEPTTGLDPATGRRISKLIRELADRFGSTSVVVTHDIDCAATVANRWVFLHDGLILADGSPEELFASQAEALVDFLAPWASLGELAARLDRRGDPNSMTSRSVP